MTTHPVGPQPAASSPNLFPDRSTCNHAHLMAGVRAGLIALVLLTILAVIVLL
jgi:hypothetical protein